MHSACQGKTGISSISVLEIASTGGEVNSCKQYEQLVRFETADVCLYEHDVSR